MKRYFCSPGLLSSYFFLGLGAGFFITNHLLKERGFFTLTHLNASHFSYFFFGAGLAGFFMKLFTSFPKREFFEI